jgi:HAMP domain-containing protein
MTINDDMELRLTALMVKDTEESVKAEDVLASSIYIETVSKLEVAERENQKLQNDLQSAMERWAVTKGDLELSRKTVDDLEEKHRRRLKELSGEEGDGATKAEDMETAKRVVQLEHKLKHALDTVRQAEAMKSSLFDATKMMETLQRQVSELKEANEQLEAAQEEINADLLTSSDENVSNEKVQRLKKEFNALMQSKENAKRNLEVRIKSISVCTFANHVKSTVLTLQITPALRK